jgi:hypothetical protein
MSSNPVRIDRLQAGLVAMVTAGCPGSTVVWAPSEYPRPAGQPSVVTVQLVAPPSAAPLGGTSKPVRALPTSATLRVLDATEGATIVTTISGWRTEYVVPAAATTETVRDALLLLYAAAPLQGITTTAVDDPGDDEEDEADDVHEIAVEADALGDLWGLSILGSDPDMIEIDDVVMAAAQAAIVDVRSFVQVQAYGIDRSPRLGAAAVLTRLTGRLMLPSLVRIRSDYGIGLVGGPPTIVGLDALSGPGWESRAAASFFVSQVSLAAEAAEVIERVSGTMSVRENASTTTIVIDTGEPE